MVNKISLIGIILDVVRNLAEKVSKMRTKVRIENNEEDALWKRNPLGKSISLAHLA